MEPITILERLRKYDEVIKKIMSSRSKTRKYLVSTGIYDKKGKLTKHYE